MRCLGINRNLHRCNRTIDGRLFCNDHRRQPFVWIFILIFTVIAGSASIYSAFQGTVQRKSDQQIITETKPNDTKHSEKELNSLYDFFMNDFNLTHMLSNYDFYIKGKVVYSATYIIWGDFYSKALFFSVYMPESDYTFNACKFLIPKYSEILSGPIRKLMKGIKNTPPGFKEESWDQLTFSRRVYIYHATPLLQDRIKTLTEEYEKARLSPQFRGPDYRLIKIGQMYDK